MHVPLLRGVMDQIDKKIACLILNYLKEPIQLRKVNEDQRESLEGKY